MFSDLLLMGIVGEKENALKVLYGYLWIHCGDGRRKKKKKRRNRKREEGAWKGATGGKPAKTTRG